MLTLQVELNDQQVRVRANERQSHSFSLYDLRLNDTELKAFVLNPRPYGSRLFQALFKDSSAAKTAFDELSKQSARTIVLVLDSPELDSVAWEYAYNEVKQEYVVEDCAFMRALPESERPANGRLKESVERVSLLFIPANPLVGLNAEPMRALDVDGELREVTRHITASHAPFDLLQLRPATPEQLQTSMARFRDGLVVHFSGHGAAMKDGTILLFERENGASNPLEAQEFIRAVKDKAGIVFLSACQSAAAEKTEFGNLARGLVKSGVPFALGMQFNLPDPFAPVISGQFYNWLAQGHAIPEATMQARRAVKRENEFFIGMIALYAAHPDETGEMNWRGSGASLVQTFRPADVSDLPSPASGLIGRQRELMRIGTPLIEDEKPLTVTLHGAGGIGKTALLWQSLLRFAPSFDLTLALALDPLPSLESILGRIERVLGLPSPCANETKERETMVRERLTSKRTLLGLDNFETVNYALNEKGSEEEKTAKSLHTFFESLAANGVTLCITSREVTNLPGETIEDIQGLTNENGGRLFQENVVRQKDEIYIEKTQQVSEMVGGHPLALRLLASAFDDQIGTSLDQYIEDLQSHLPKARDKWTEEDRHESLRASFNFTMNNLVKTEEGKELQVALSTLSVFSAPFATLFAAPVIAGKVYSTEEEMNSQNENAKRICFSLWKHGLLENTRISSNEEKLNLFRMHPALRFFAKVELTDFTPVQENFWQSMYNLSRWAEENVGKDPLTVQIVLHSMPDLLSAAEAKSGEDAAKMQHRLSHIIQQFGSYDDALKLSEKSREIFESLNLKREKAVVIGEMARIYEVHGDFTKSIELQNEKLKIAREIGEKREESVALNNLAGIYATLEDSEQAMKLYTEALKINEDLGDRLGKSDNLVNMAVILRRSDDLQEAMKLYKESLEIKKEFNDLQGQIRVLANMARLLQKNKDYDKAIELFQEALELSHQLSELFSIASVSLMMSELFVELKEYQKGLDCLLDAFNLFVKMQANHETKIVVSEMQRMKELLGEKEFVVLWNTITNSSLPDWLMQSPEEQFIAGAIQSAREKRPEAEQYFKEAQRLAGSADVPAELQELGKVLQKIMLGAPADLSTLTGELREIVEKALNS